MSDFESPLDALAYLDTEHADLQAQVQSLISDEMDQMRRSGLVQDYLAPYPLPPMRFVRSLSLIFSFFNIFFVIIYTFFFLVSYFSFVGFSIFMFGSCLIIVFFELDFRFSQSSSIAEAEFERVAAGQPVRDLVPEDVELYIAEQGLYAAP